MALVAQGDAVACRLLVQRHLSPLVGLALRITNNNSEVEDIAQEAFVRLWKQSANWQAKAKIWLFSALLSRKRCRPPSNLLICMVSDNFT
ncbi:sigma factor [Kiloniella sp.]|uniref:sigma factor n=1 Tax=Kiloniella sp. TaxID=1938587 RepID=UPI003B02474E